jgi:hypothetical protein
VTSGVPPKQRQGDRHIVTWKGKKKTPVTEGASTRPDVKKKVATAINANSTVPDRGYSIIAKTKAIKQIVIKVAGKSGNNSSRIVDRDKCST